MRTRLGLVAALAGLGFAALMLALWESRAVPRDSGPLTQEAYLWQRAWTPAVTEAVARADPAVSRLVVLGAEVAWIDGAPHVARTELDYVSLRASQTDVGVALRVGSYGGPFEAEADGTRLVLGLAADLLVKTRAADLVIAEFQIDFDCAESRLGGYRRWLAALKDVTGTTPLTFTALPCWLDHGEFAELAEAADGFVLQVHSLSRPASINAPLTLCDTSAARAAVERAARFGQPFRVALPTYGYLLAFDSLGRFVGLSAEGPSPRWPADVRVRALRSDPAEMATLVRAWRADRPPNMTGIIWYRLPTRDDRMNWRPPTFSLVIAGRTPQGRLLAETRRTEPGLVEVHLLNSGQASVPLDAAVRVRWHDARLLAADAIGGFQRVDAAADDEMRLVPTARTVVAELRPGESKTIGWLRLSEPGEVQVDVVLENP